MDLLAELTYLTHSYYWNMLIPLYGHEEVDVAVLRMLSSYKCINGITK